MTIERADGLPQPGETFAGKYTIVRVVGEGGVGVVFEAQHQRLQQSVAIKVLRSEVRQSDEWLARFDREARAAVALRGPNVARVFDVDSLPDGTPYMVMELLEGRDLASEMDERGPLPSTEAVGYILEACAAMAEAHALGIVHRDLTPRNLFLAVEGDRRTVKVVDFGISKITSERSNVTATDAAFGTPNYVSPEQIRSSSHVDSRADIWSLAVILFELLSGELPFQGSSASAVVASVAADPPQSLRDLRPELPKKLVSVVMTALEKDPNERYQSIEEFAAAIAPFGPEPVPAPGDPVPPPSGFGSSGTWARPAGAWVQPRRPQAKRRAGMIGMWIALVVVAIAIAVPAVRYGLQAGSSDAPPDPTTAAASPSETPAAAPSAEPTSTPAPTQAAAEPLPTVEPAAAATAGAAPSAAGAVAPAPTPRAARPAAPPAAPRATTPRHDTRDNPLHL